MRAGATGIDCAVGNGEAALTLANPAAKTRLRELDAARGLSVLLVVLWHATLAFQPTDHALYKMNWLLESFRMPTLLLISGILASSLRHRPAAATGRRALDLLWLYLLWTPLNLLFEHGTTDIAQKVAMELVVPQRELWFLWVLAALTFSTRLFRGRAVPAILAVSLCVAVLARLLDIRGGELGYVQCLRYGFYFYLGFYQRDRIVRLLQAARPGHLPLLGFAYVGLHFGDSMVQRATGLSPLAPAQALALACGALVVCRLLVGSPPVRMLGWIGQRTVGVYLMHMSLLLVMKELAAGAGFAPTTGMILAATAVAAILSLCLYQLANGTRLDWLFHRPAWALDNRMLALPIVDGWRLFGGRAIRDPRGRYHAQPAPAARASTRHSA